MKLIGWCFEPRSPNIPQAAFAHLAVVPSPPAEHIKLSVTSYMVVQLEFGGVCDVRVSLQSTRPKKLAK